MERYLPGQLSVRHAQRIASPQISKEITVTTPTLRLTDTSVITATVDALVVGTMCGEGGPQPLPGNEEVDAAFGGELEHHGVGEDLRDAADPEVRVGGDRTGRGTGAVVPDERAGHDVVG